jgi:putative transposase
MDEAHPIAALQHVALNPVRARVAARAEDWRWNVRAPLDGKDDGQSDRCSIA